MTYVVLEGFHSTE